jgi:hypothetical protein
MKDNDSERLERATSARLARLGARPVDTTDLERRLERAIAAEVEPDRGNAAGIERPSLPAAWRRGWRLITSSAAVVLIVVTIGWLVLDGGTSPAMAAPAELAQIHYDVANGLSPHLKVSSVAEANQLLADQSNGVVPVPELPGVMMSCCLHQHAGTTLTCALIERDGQLITVAIADGAKLHSPHDKTITRGNRQFVAHTANGINMVMAHAGDRWLCVMGEVDFEQLADVAVKVRL